MKSKIITKLFDRFMNRRVKIWNDKEIASTLTVSGTVTTAVGIKILSNVPRKTCVKILINKCGCLKHYVLFKCNFFSTGVILLYRLVFDTILAALFWMHCNLCTLNLERLLKSELQ